MATTGSTRSDGTPSGKPSVPRPGLPAPGDLGKPAVPRPSFTSDLDLDLPAPRDAGPRALTADDLDVDLPAPKSGGFGAAPGAAKPPLDDDFELDLPAPKSPPALTREPSAPRMDLGIKKPIAPPVDLALPAPKAAVQAAMGPSDDLDLGALELPVARPPRLAPAAFDDDLELPAPRVTGSELDLPAPKGAPGRRGTDELDLLAPRAAALGGAAAFAAELDLELPTIRSSSSLPRPNISALEDSTKTPFDELDLPAPRDAAAPRALGGSLGGAFGELDLPTAPGGGLEEFDLPMPRRGADLPASGGTDFGDLDLSVPKGATFGHLDLPELTPGDLDLPVPEGAGLGELDLPSPTGAGFGDLDLPRMADELFSELELPKPGELLEPPRGDARAGSSIGGGELDFGDLELPEQSAAAPEERASQPPPETRGTPGGTGFGELNLGEASIDDMEFADLPQGGASGEFLPPPRLAAHKKAPTTSRPAKSAGPRKGRAVLWVGVVVVLLLGAGGALALTPYGLFGAYFFERFMPGAGDPAQVRAAIQRAEEQARGDGYGEVRDALTTLGRARRDAGLNRELLARSLVHESLYLVRFGNDANSASRASTIRSRLEERGADAPELALAFAADALRARQLTVARTRLAEARRHAPEDAYVDLVTGELALVRGDLEEAAQAFSAAAERGTGARGSWGVARARLAGDDAAAALAAVEAVIAESPRHGEALVTRAELHLQAQEHERASALAERLSGRRAVEGERLHEARSVRARAWTVLGRIEEDRGRGSRALAAYDAALAALDSHVPALLGAGRVLLAERPNDARARFDAVLQAGAAAALVLPNGRTAQQEAQLGAARANLALEQPQDALALLGPLAAAREQDGEVSLYLGHAVLQQDPPDREAAEQHFRAAVDAAPQLFPAYVALAELLLATERLADAGAVLDQATERVPESADVRLTLGDFELRRDRPEAAIEQLRRALELDPELPAARFSLGVAQRRAGQLDDAAATFEALARIDPRHPRLALERGLVFEVRGESERAVEAYRAAWNEDQDDVDLLLRLGAAQVAAGRMEDAGPTLERVRQALPSSAEASHLLGRVALAQGRATEASRLLNEAVRLDPARGELHMYAGWAALENNQLGEALISAEAAIARDASLGEAYWVRGVVHLRSGNPAQALTDLQTALRLRPSLHRAHADMGDAYEELNRLSEAVAAFERAVAQVDDEGAWWWRLGRLRMDRGERRGAAQALDRATLLGEASSPPPGWLAAAHRWQGEALRFDGQRAEAIRHYQRYLELAPSGDIDRAEVQRTLRELGAR